MDNIASPHVETLTALEHDTIKKAVEEEGIGARNLLNWIADGSLEGSRTSKKPPLSPRPQSTSPNPQAQNSAKGTEHRFQFKTTKRCGSISRPKSRLRSASAGRNPEKDLRTRYWTFLFENLHRAVDEIYQTCEMDESIVESKEAIMMLENYSKDFRSLIQWLNISKSYDKTAPLNRPTSLAWEVRKSSPGKSLLKNVFIEKLTAGNSQTKRVLCFDTPRDPKVSAVLPEGEKCLPIDVKIRCSDNLSAVDANSADVDKNSVDEATVEAKQDDQKNVYGHNKCGVVISVHSSPEAVFPCNQDLVIKEVLCLSDSALDENSKSDISKENTESHDMNAVSSVDESEIDIPDDCGKDESLVNAQNTCLLVETSINNCDQVELENTSSELEQVSLDTKSNSSLSTAMEKVTDLPKSTEMMDLKNVTVEVSTSTDEVTNNNQLQPTSNNSLELVVSSTSNNMVTSDQPNEVSTSTHEVTKKPTCNGSLEVLVSSTSNNMVTSDQPNEVSTSTHEVTKKPTCNGSLEVLVSSPSNNMATSDQPNKSVPQKTGQNDKRLVKQTEQIQSSKSVATQNVESSRNAKSTVLCKSTISSSLTKSKTSGTSATGVSGKQSVENGTMPSVCGVKSVGASKPSSATIKRSTIKSSVAVSEKKPSRVANSEPLAKRSTLSTVVSNTKNLNVKPIVVSMTPKIIPSRTVSYAVKPPQKSGSLSSLNSIRGVRSWADKVKTASVEQIPGSNVKKSKADEDSDGWETVRGRTRCRNSPAKNVPVLNDKKDNQVAQLVKLNQSRIGGFPYTTKSNSQAPVKNSQKSTEKKISDISKEKLKIEEKENDIKSVNIITKLSTSTPEMVKKKLVSTPVTNVARTLLNTKKTPDVKQNNAINSSKGNNIENITKKFSKIVHTPTQNKSVVNPATKTLGKSPAVSKVSDLSVSHDVNIAQIANKEILLEKKLLHLPLNKKENYEIERTFDLPQPNSLKKSSSAPSLFEFYDENPYCLKKYLSDSENSGEPPSSSPKNSKVYKKKSSDKISNLSKKRGKMDTNDGVLNTSLNECDIGGASDDQDGILSHDDAFDVQTQELYDTAWKYKILEQQVHKLELSWGEQMDRLDMELRTPGRALEMHEKLSSPFRKRNILDSIRLCNEKQLKAQEQRERFLEEKAQKFKDIQKKRLEMKTLVERRQEQQRCIMEQKLQRAEEKRKKQLDMIIRKAHDEEEKVNEIAFINTLEAQNKRHDLISKEKDHEARLQDIQDERQRRQEEKAVKEAAAEERRKILEAERQARLIEMQEKRKLKDLKIEQQFLEKEKERQELANQKARDRELRLSALNAAQQITIEELQKKIQLKQEESARRHEENIEQIRLKAFELSIRRCSSNNDDAPQPVPYETKKICTMCNVLIGSEVYLLSHLRGKKHQETVKDQHQGQDPSTEELELYNLKHIVDASTDRLDPNIALDKERQKALKKRCKKLRQRMSNRGLEYASQLEKAPEIANSNQKIKMEKIISDCKKVINMLGNCNSDTALLTSLERCFNEMERFLDKGSIQNKASFCTLGGIGVLVEIFTKVSSFANENSAFLLKKTINRASHLAEFMVGNCYENCHYVLFSNKIGSLLDILIRRLNILIPDNYSQVLLNSSKSSGINLQVDQVAGKLMHLLSTILIGLSETRKNGSVPGQNNNVEHSKEKEKMEEEFQQRGHDVISYIVSIGIVDKLSQYFHSTQGPISNETEVASFLLDCIAFLTALIKFFSESHNMTLEHKKTEDATQLIATFKVTNMVGAVSLLYGLLLHNGASSRGETPPLQLPKHTENVALSTLCMLNHMAVMNLQAFQGILGSEGLSLQLRHITSHLLWYCNHWTSDLLLHEVILLVGFFTVSNAENQLIIQAGQRPTVLQQLCSVPFLYFSDSTLSNILFPTLISCCFNSTSNKTILEQEMSSELLSNYIEAQSLNIHDATINSNNSKTTVNNKRWLFSTRFPKDRWSSAKHYFSVGLVL